MTTSELQFRHVGGGPKGVFLAVRYVFVISAAYLLVFESAQDVVPPVQALTIAGALASNVLLSFVPPGVLFAPWVAAPLLLADTAWVAWAFRAMGAMGDEFFLLYLFVMVLAAVGENALMVVLGAVGASAMIVYASWGEGGWTSPALLRVVFLFTAALFYGHVLHRLRHERQRGDRSLDWARELEARVAERTTELNRLYEASRAASKAKTEFMASMSHEVRTPLHIIMSYADILLEGAAASAADGIALGRRIRKAASALLHLVDNVLEMGRLDLEHVRVEPRPVRVTDFVEELRQREWIPPLPGVTLRWDVDTEAMEIETDSTKLSIIVTNLVTNALKYTRAGETAVSVRGRHGGEGVDFRVEDTGPGIPGTPLARLREPFHDSAQSGEHKLAGVGLGLAIVYRYAILLGAEVSVFSTVGRGTRFVVTVPRRFDSRPAARAALLPQAAVG